jgi:hypothetical protein
MKSLKTLRYLLPLMAITIIFSSCEGDGWNNIRGTGPTYSETRDVPIHRDISVSIPADVYIYQSLAKDVTIEAQSNVLDVIETYVSGSELKIKLENGVGLGRHEPIKIYISSAMFNTIRLSGSVNLYSETPIVTDVFDISVSGSGNIDVAVVANTVRASISGSGKMWFEGTAITTEYTVSGSGDIYAFDLLSETADINISGSGKTEVSVEEFLKARISGSGSVYYRGFPSVDSRISGSGKVIRVN